MAKLLQKVVFFDTRDNPNNVSDLSAQVMADEGNRAMSMGHKIPVGLGHMITDDSAPALGWVVPGSLKAEGTKVIGSVQLTDEGQRLCANGSYRSLSIEVLRGVTVDGQRFESLIDRVALLGSAPPAVRTLSDMQALAASRHADAVLAFASAFELPPDDSPTRQDFAALTAERDTLKARATAAEAERDQFKAAAATAETTFTALKTRIDGEEFDRLLNQLVLDGRLLPWQAHKFAAKRKQSPQTFTADNLLDIALPDGQRRTFARGLITAKLFTTGGEAPDNPATELRAATIARQTQQAALGIREDYITSSIAAAKARPDLTAQMFTQLFRARPNGR
jgi:hypothetical protein